MGGRLAGEIQQGKPFASLEEEAMLNLVRTHEHVQQRMAEFFKQYQLTRTQYNVLRILRGAGEAGLTCSQVSERMVSADPDITRMLDRLESRDLIARSRTHPDRRVVLTRITPDGLALLESIDKPLAAFNRSLFGGQSKRDLERLVEILESIREE